MNFSTVMEWVKANVFIVIFGVIIVVAPIAMWFVASGMNKGVRDEVSNRAQKYPLLVKIENTSIDIPGQAPIKGVINEAFLTKYGQYAEALGKDAEVVQKAAVEHNRRSHKVVREGVLPEMPASMREVLPQKFWEDLMAAYQKLLVDVNAGTPPTLESMREEIERVQFQFITQQLQKDVNAPLTEQEAKSLGEKLTEVRVAECAEVADKTGVYLSLNELETPQYWAWPAQPSMTDLYNWQWQYWIQEDILGALHEVNKADQSAARSPVKRVIGLRIAGLPGGGGPAGSPAGPRATGTGRLGTGGSGRAAEGGGMGEAGGEEGEGGGAAPAGPSGGAANPKAPVALNYSASFTGRTSNALYDVIWVDLTMVVETARLNQVIDALARQNFITVTSLVLEPADPFEAAREGYFYGSAPVSTVTMQLETIWLRAWTSQFMPNDVKKTLSVPMAPLAAAAAGAPAAP